MKKLLIICLVVISNQVTGEERIVPVAEFTAKNTDWQSNLYGIYYVACRCGFAYQAAYEEMKKHSEDEIDTSLHDRGYVMVMSMADYVYEHGEGIANHQVAFENQMEAIFAFYQNEAAKSYIKNNHFKGIIGKDISTCKSYESFYDGLVRRAV
jgi:hypothetical protein